MLNDFLFCICEMPNLKHNGTTNKIMMNKYKLLFFLLLIPSMYFLFCNRDNAKLRRDIEPIQKRLHSINGIIDAQWTFNESPQHGLFFSPPSLDTCFFIKGIITLNKSEYDTLLGEYNDLIPFGLNNDSVIFGIKKLQGLSSQKLIKDINNKNNTTYISKFVFLKNNKIYFEMKLR